MYRLYLAKSFDIWQQTKDDRKTIAVFCDLSTPSAKVLKKGFCVYTDLRDKLIGLGIPEKEIAFIHDAKNAKQKKRCLSVLIMARFASSWVQHLRWAQAQIFRKNCMLYSTWIALGVRLTLEQQEGRIELSGKR